MKFDTLEWGKFKLQEIFQITTGACVKKERLKQGDIPRISVTGINNGIQGFFQNINDKNYREQENFISFSFLGTCFYHPYKASLDMKVHCLKPLNYVLNKYSGLFLVNVFKKSYSGVFNNQISSTDLKNEIISLPTDKDGKPDWEFMENTIKSTQNKMTKIIKAYELVKNGGGGGNSLNSLAWPAYSQLDSQTHHFLQEALMQIAVELMNDLPCKWKEFQLTALFDYERGTRLTKNDRTKGKYPLVTAGEQNQGVKEYISNKNQKVFKNAITIDMFCNCFVHIEDFCCDDNILVLTAKQGMSKYAMQFISAVINKDKEKWGYGKQYRQNSLEKHSIFLPSDDTNAPNFALMEKFIKNIEQEHSAKLLKFYEVLKANGGGGGHLT